MTTFLIGLAVLTLLILIALKMGLDRKEAESGDEPRKPLIHVSGIYSILRQSPREDLAALRPGEEEIRRYLMGVTQDVNGAAIGPAQYAALIKHWKVQIEVNLREIETGDKNGVMFYYYDFPRACPVCAPFITKGNFVTREEIYKNPQIIPPLHLGCMCVFTAHHGNDSQLRETTMDGMIPFFDSEAPPPLPEWTGILSLSATAEAKK